MNFEELAPKAHVPCESVSADDVLRLALDIAEHILENGGEISRVENTIERIGYALGAAHVESFAVTTLITASMRMKNGSYSQQMRRVKNTDVNLYRVEKLNAVSRDICSGAIDIETAHKQIAEVKHSHQFKRWVMSLGHAMIAIGFVLYFGGNFRDGLVAALIGVPMMFIHGGPDGAFNTVSQTALRSFAAGAAAIILTRVGIGTNASSIMIGTIMLMIPGMAVGTSIGDMLGKNIISGTMRLTQAITQAVIIALGYAAAILVMGGVA